MTSCLLCGNTGAFQVFCSRQQRKGEMTVYLKCLSCTFVFLEKKPGKEEVELHYHNIWNDKKEDPLFREKSLRSAHRLLAQMERYVQLGRFLDVGAGPGFYMEAAEKRGWEAFGVEPAVPEIIVKEKRKLFRSTLEETNLQPHFFDACLIHHTLGHLQNPLQTLKEVFRLLKHHGILLVVVPNFLRLGQRRIGTQWDELVSGRHLYLFSPKTAKKILQKANFEILSVDTSQPVLTGEQVEKIGITMASSLRTFLETYLARPIQFLRACVGKLCPGPAIQILARKIKI